MEELDAVSLERCGLAGGSTQNGSLPAMLTSDWLEEELETLLWSSAATDVLQLYVEAAEDEKVHVSSYPATRSGRVAPRGGRRTEVPVLLARLHSDNMLSRFSRSDASWQMRSSADAEAEAGSAPSSAGPSRHRGGGSWSHVCMAESFLLQRNVWNSSRGIQKRCS